MQRDQKSRQLEIAEVIDRPEPRMDECVSPEDKLYKAHCVLLDVLSRQHRGIALKDDAENMTCMAEAVGLLGDALRALVPFGSYVDFEGREMSDAAHRLAETLMKGNGTDAVRVR